MGTGKPPFWDKHAIVLWAWWIGWLIVVIVLARG